MPVAVWESGLCSQSNTNLYAVLDVKESVLVEEGAGETTERGFCPLRDKSKF